MDLIKEIVIDNPPTKYVDRKKTKIDPNTGKLKEDVYYLTANLFYGGIPYYLRSKITNLIKTFLLPYLNGIPKLSKCRIEVIYQKPQDTFDIDNKAYFWVKMILDLLKTPSSRQLKNAHLKGRDIKSVNVLKDDTVRYIDEIIMRYKTGPHKLIIRVFGNLDSPTLFDK